MARSVRDETSRASLTLALDLPVDLAQLTSSTCSLARSELARFRRQRGHKIAQQLLFHQAQQIHQASAPVEPPVNGNELLRAIAERAEAEYAQLRRLHAQAQPAPMQPIILRLDKSKAESESELTSLWRQRSRALQARVNALSAEKHALQTRLPAPRHPALVSSSLVSAAERRQHELSAALTATRSEIVHEEHLIHVLMQQRDELLSLQQKLATSSPPVRVESSARAEALHVDCVNLSRTLANFLETHFPPEDGEDGVSLASLLQQLMHARLASTASGDVWAAYVRVDESQSQISVHVGWLLRHGLAQRHPTRRDHIALPALDV